jgi:PAS domain S-box-containing protein
MRADSVETDLLDLGLDSSELMAAIAAALAEIRCSVPASQLRRELANARCVLVTQDWAAFEKYLETLGIRYARAGIELSVWQTTAFTVLGVVQARVLAVHGGAPARLAALLASANGHVQRSLLAITRGYYRAKELREREVMRRHSTLMDAAIDAVIEIDEHGVVTELNLAAERMFGFRKAEALGRPLVDLVIPDHRRAQVQTLVERAVETGTSGLIGKRLEVSALHADGSEFPIELSLVVAERLDGKRCLIAWIRDQRERTRVEESLALRDHALEHAQFGIIVSSSATRRITSINPAYARLTGYSAEELIGEKPDWLIDPDEREQVSALMARLEERGHLTYRLNLRAKDGSHVPVLASTSTVTTSSGSAVRVSTVIDISEQVKLEDERAAAQREVAHSAARLLILSAASHEFSAASGSVDELLSLVARRMGQVLGEGCAVRVLSGDGEWLEPSAHVYYIDAALGEAARRIIASERQRVGEGLVGRVAATGEAAVIPDIDAEALASQVPAAFRPMLVRAGVSSAMAIPLRARGRTLGVVSLLRVGGSVAYTETDQQLAQDLADRAGLALDNALLVSTLEHRVAERTAALEAANRDLEAFTYYVSHDLRTPLRAIDGFSLALVEDHAAQLDALAQRYLRQIRGAAGRMGQLINDLLALARVSRSEASMANVDLSSLALDVAAHIRAADPGRTTPIHVAPGLVSHGDARLLRIAFENLLGNAWKYTAKHPRAEIWVGSDGHTFHVRDTGAGFDMKYANKLFRPFQRLHVGHEYEGTGIGLAIVARILTHHGGRIWATAAVEEGATFYFTLGTLGTLGGATP